MPTRGRFFAFEGIDGVGKTTQRVRFVAWLQSLGRDVVTCQDPGGTALGEKLRDLLLHTQETPIAPRAEMLLYLASRAQLVHEVIAPALNAGQVVVSDRFHLSTLAYQVYARGLDVEATRPVGLFATGTCLPDLVFLLDMDAAEAARRRHRPADRIEARGLEYLRAVRDGFLAEAEIDPQRVVVIDASGDEETVARSVRQAAMRIIEADREKGMPQ